MKSLYNKYILLFSMIIFPSFFKSHLYRQLKLR
jgi:hypothetical protein